MPTKGLVERLRDGESVIVAEGYLFEFERKGFLKSGSFVPEVVLEHPELVTQLHEEFVHAGSDVVLAFTYYGHREKLKLINREDDLERMNLQALKIARDVADRTGTLMAGNICNTTVYMHDNPSTIEPTKAMFKEQVEWAVQGGADFIVAETFPTYGEAALALESILKYGNGLPAVVTLIPLVANETVDGIPLGKACRKLEDAGASVVGLNCGRGPSTVIESLEAVRAECRGHIACLPVPYRTNSKQRTFFSLSIPGSDVKAFPLNLHTCLCTREDVQQFAAKARSLGCNYVGLCCGGSPNLLRIVATAYGKNPPANAYAPELHKHFVFSDSSEFSEYFRKEMRNKLVSES